MSPPQLSLKRESLLAFSARAVTSAIGLVGLVLLARLLGPETLGVYFVLLAGAQVAGLMTLGVGQAVQKRVSEVDTEAEELLGFTLGFSFLYIAVVVVGSVGLYLSGVFPDAVTVSAFIGFTAAFIGATLFPTVYRFYAGVGKPGRATWFETLYVGAILTVQVVLLVQGFSVGWLLGAYGVSGVAISIVVLVEMGIRPQRPSKAVLIDTAQFARWTVGSAIFSTAYNRVNPLLLGLLIGATGVGLFESAARLSVPGLMLASSLALPLLIMVSTANSSGQKIHSEVQQAVDYSSLLAVPVFFGAVAIGTPLLYHLYGAEFAAGALILQLVTLARIFTSLRAPLGAFLVGRDRPQLTFAAMVLLLGVHLALGILLTIEYGLIGLGLSMVLAEVLTFCFLLFVTRWLEGRWFIPTGVGTQLLAGVVMYLVVLSLRVLLPVSSPGILAPFLVVGAGVYFSVYDLISGGDLRRLLRPIVAGWTRKRV